MTENGEREVLRLLNRLVESTERVEVHWAGERPKPTPPADLKDVATAVRLRRGGDRGDAPDDRGLTRGGTPPEEFWARREP